MFLAMAAAPFPEPQPDITVLVPEPSPFVTPIVSLAAVDPWAWSLDTVVAIIAALASAAVAIVAIVLTNNRAKADHDRQAATIEEERGLRERAERKIVGDSALAYIRSIDIRGANSSALERLERAFADTDIAEEPLYRWLVESGKTRFEAEFIAHEEANPDPDSEEPSSPSWFAYKTIDADLHSRIRAWIRTGEMDTTPLSTLSQILNHQGGAA